VYTLPKGFGDWVFEGVNGVGLVDVVRVPLSLAAVEAHVPDKQFRAKIKMAMRCWGVGREEVGVKCGCMQGCCVGASLITDYKHLSPLKPISE